MICLPNRDFTRRIANGYGVFVVLGALYVITLVGAIVAGITLTQPHFTPVTLTTAEGLATLLANPYLALVVWLHMLTLDLVGGHWIYNTAQRLGAPILLR